MIVHVFFSAFLHPELDHRMRGWNGQLFRKTWRLALRVRWISWTPARCARRVRTSQLESAELIRAYRTSILA
jgi:hypothetical protein